MHVPGSAASTVHVASLVNSLPRWLLRSHCSLAGFLRSIVQCPADRTDAATSPSRGSSTWPMPLPYPEAFSRGCSVSGLHHKRMVCLHVMVLDWLCLNRPSAAPRELRLGARLTPKQWSAVAVLKRLAWDGNTPDAVDAVSMGRSAAKFESFEADLGAIHRAAFDCLRSTVSSYACSSPKRNRDDFSLDSLRSGFLAGRVERAPIVAAKSIQSKRLVFSGAPRFCPQPYLDERTAEIYDAPLKLAADPASHLGPVPKVRVFADAQNKVSLYKKLASTGRLKPVPSSCKRGPYVSGMFCVCKDLERDRLILDSRPPNILECKGSVWTNAMASASSLVDLCLQEDQVLVASGEDLKDFFYQFQTTPERAMRNILSDPLSLEEAVEVFGPAFEWHEDPVWVGLSTLAMGDSNSCEFAQCSHLSLCRRRKVFEDEELLSLRGHVPRGLLSVGIIIDDLVVLEKVLRSEFDAYKDGKMTLRSQERLERALCAYSEAGLEVNHKKEFKAELCSRFWGIELDGNAGLLRPSSLRLWPVLLITLRVASLGLCSVSLLEALAGSWISMFSLRRRLMCTMELVFEALAISDQKAVIRLSPAMIDELWTMALLGPLACINLRAQPTEFLVATDSSLSWTAGVSARLPKSICAEVMRRSLKRGVWSKLLPPHKAWLREHALLSEGEEMPGEGYSSHPLWNMLASCLQYEFNWRKPILQRRHINVTELDANLNAEKRCSANLKHKRILFALDSQVALGALVKGRASSSALNDQLRRSLAHMLGADLYGYYIYFPSPLNRADAPTRDADVPGPDVELPNWWHSAANGDFALFDEWISAMEAGVVEPEFDLEQLVARAQPDFASARKTRDEAFGQAKRLHRSVSSLRASLKPDLVPGPRKIRDEPPGQAKRLHRSVNSLPASLDPDLPPESGRADDESSGLCAEALQILRSFNTNQFFAKTKPFILREAGALDLYSGRFGVARQLVQCGAPWVLTFEIERSSSEDLLDPYVHSRILRLIELKAVKILGAAIVCRSFTTAITPPIRSKRNLRGVPGLAPAMKAKVTEGNSQADNLDEILHAAEANGCGFWFENPDLSWLFKQRKYAARYGSSSSSSLFRFCMCRFGTPWKKPTRVGTNIPGLAGLRLWCKCRRKHLVLRGRSAKHKKNWTLVAQPYPLGLCKLLALACSIHAQWTAYKKLDIGACCRSSSQRIGEASNPGPRYSAARRGLNLHGVHLRTPATEALEARQLHTFMEWCRVKLPSVDLSVVFDVAPSFLADVLCIYGVEQFNFGGALSNFRHLVLAVQRWKPMFRIQAGKCWEIVGKWEICEPVSHRPPIPEVVVKSIVCLAWQLRWYRFCGVTLLAFYGAGRIGEVLKCRGSDLLFPQDALDESSCAVFLQLKQFKSLGRQPSRVQHMKVDHKQACNLLSKIFLLQPGDTVLYPASTGVYRRRWDFLLKTLEIPATSKLTPGSLRGGAAVHAYKSGKSVNDIMWSLRLRSQQTLESYLQEVAAIGALRDLPADVRRRLYVFGAIFDHLFPGAIRDPVLGQ